MKFLFDLFPLILFFVTYKLTSHGAKSVACQVSANLPLIQEPILIATSVAIAATFLQVGWLMIRGRKVEKMLCASLGVIVVFGSATLYFRDPTFIQWKPTILYWLIGTFLAFSTYVLKKNPIRQVMEEQISLPDPIWSKLNVAWIVFFILAGAANLVAMHLLDCDGWVSFKVYGLIGLMFIFAFGQALALSRYIEE
ncbi:MAG: septation protein A [Methylobacterium sp.]|nr:septation protein A [Methylobacterium sp.]